MKRSAYLLFLIVFLILFLSCRKDKSASVSAVPACIQSKINYSKQQSVANPPASVYKFNYNGQTVFYFPAKCCDQLSELYDSNCSFICSPDGGITGSGDGKCSDFFQQRKNEKLIWQDSRQ